MLGVVGLVIGGIWVAASAVQEKMRINTLLNNVAVTYSNLQNLFAGQPLTGDVVVSNSLLEMVAPKGQILGNQLIDPMDSVTDISINLRVGPPRHVEFLFNFHGDGGQRGIRYCTLVAPLLGSRFRAYGETAAEIPSIIAADDSAALYTLDLAGDNCYALGAFYLRLPL